MNNLELKRPHNRAEMNKEQFPSRAVIKEHFRGRSSEISVSVHFKVLLQKNNSVHLCGKCKFCMVHLKMLQEIQCAPNFLLT